jgi:acyl-CoA thioesterase I
MRFRHARVAPLAAIALAVSIAQCSTPPPQPPPDQTPGQGVLPEPGQLPEAQRTVIAVLGDSLTAGLGLTLSQSYPSRLQEMFAAEGYGEVEIANAGLSGDTTAGGLRRLPSVLAQHVTILVVALGGNDALRGLSTTQTHDNLAAIIDAALASGVRVLLAGMEGPTNLGQDYRDAFRNAFSQLGRDYRGRISYVPFLLEGVAGDPALNQADGIHPNPAGVEAIVARIAPHLEPLIERVRADG